MIEALALGLAYGLATGVAPTQLLAHLIAAGRRHGLRAALQTAVAPLVTDLSLLVVALFALDQLSDRAIGVIGILGTLWLARLAWDTWDDARTADPTAAADRTRQVKGGRHLRRGVLSSALSPGPVLFWVTIAGPTMTRLDDEHGIAGPIVFAACFLALVVGMRAAVAVLVSVARRSLGGRLYRWYLAATSVLLAVLAVLLAIESVRLAW
ncbi:MAG: hypothetical protein FJW96_12760 [Actinobacteria bacterium]|nr:hypothetical protein [Actinomycetota bacterium]